jgi:general secretion pathway protein D
MDFMDKPIQDILIAIALQSKLSIVPDETVTGNATFYFPETDARTALRSFLSAYKLYMRDEGGVIYISRIDVSLGPSGTLSVNADDVDASALLRALSRSASKTILFDSIPKTSVTVHSNGLTLRKAVEIVMARFPDYQVAGDDDYIQVKRVDQTPQGKAQAKAGHAFKRDASGSYSIDAPQARFFDLIDELMRMEKREYSLLMRSDVLLERLRFEKKPFEKMLELVLEPAGADYAVRDGIVYVFELSRKDPARKLKKTESLALTWIAAQDAVSLLSQDLANSSLYRIDKNSNTVILTGNEEEIGLLAAFLRQIDRPLEGREMLRYRTSFIKAKELAALVPPRLLPIAPVMTPNEYVFLALLDPLQKGEFESFLARVDRKEESVPIVLQYIKAEDLLKNLPPSAAKEDVQDAGFQNIVFFTGTEERLKRFKRDLALIDRPRAQIRYDVLAIQYTRTKASTFDVTGNAKKVSTADGKDTAGTAFEARDAWSLVGALGEVFDLKFDVLSLLGVNFGTELNAKLSSMDTQVLTDTSLTALSGQEVKFQATSTVRYIEPEIDSEGKKTATGPTHDLSSGLVLSLNGWISGDGMVTMTVSASLSEESTTSETSEYLVYPTTERVVNTQLRTQAGEAVVISGLLQRNTMKTRTRIPGLGQIPGVGPLFTPSAKDSDEIKELAIYVVPRIVREDRTRAGSLRRMERIYDEFCAPKGNAAP